ncbi:MAG: hypothetical protein QM752_02490 [Gammaproteobacteria bacterium]
MAKHTALGLILKKFLFDKGMRAAALSNLFSTKRQLKLNIRVH